MCVCLRTPEEGHRISREHGRRLGGAQGRSSKLERRRRERGGTFEKVGEGGGKAGERRGKVMESEGKVEGQGIFPSEPSLLRRGDDVAKWSGHAELATLSQS